MILHVGISRSNQPQLMLLHYLIIQTSPSLTYKVSAYFCLQQDDEPKLTSTDRQGSLIYAHLLEKLKSLYSLGSQSLPDMTVLDIFHLEISIRARKILCEIP